MEALNYLKRSVRDSLVWLVVKTGAVARYQQRIRTAGPLVRVVCFHDVRNRMWFASILDLFTQRYHVLTPQQFKNRELVPDRINVLITFDDGYRSWVDNVLPELAARDMEALFFVSSGLLDAGAVGGEVATHFVRERLRLRTERTLLDWTGARTLLDAGHTLGGHTRTHAQLSACDEEERIVEVVKDRELLEEKLSTSLEYFAYPFGTTRDYTPAVLTTVKTAGYHHAFTAVTGFTTPTTDSYQIPRTLLEENAPLIQVQYWIEGGYDVISNLAN